MSARFEATALVVPFENLRMSDVEVVGGKNASLGEMISQLPQGVRVPTGFATTAHAFREFLKHEGLAERISARLAALDVDDVRALAQDIVDTAVKAGNFKTLVAAVQAAGLVDTLKGPGPFTVFAPTDEAFAKIPKATLDGLLADKAALTKVLTYHVVPGKVIASDVKAGKVKTVQGQELTVTTSMGVMVDQSKVVATDVAASNGVIHAVDTVLMPK